MTAWREGFENNQVRIYFGAVVLAALLAFVVPASTALEPGINPALGVMLFVTFLQVPLADLGRAFLQVRFLSTLLAANFIAVPILVLGLIQFLPVDPMLRLGVLLVLLTPCIDYVVTFALSKAQVRLAQAAMAQRDTSVSDLCKELGIERVTLYRYVGPQGELRSYGKRVLGLA